jgi:hypothetical protein
MTIKEGEYGWIWLQWTHKTPGINSAWKLVCGPNSSTAIGFLLHGTRRNPGWFVSHDTRGFQKLATLPNTMGKDEAMAVAKTILLSQGNSHDQQL